VLGATTRQGTDVLVVERPGAPDDRERHAAARVASRPAVADALTLAVARRWADPAANRPMPPALLTASRAMAWLLAALVGIDLIAGAPVPLVPLVVVAAALALVAAGLAVLGRLGIAGAAVDEGVRVVRGPVLDLARAAVDGDAAAVARLEDLRAAWWAGPVDADPGKEVGDGAGSTDGGVAPDPLGPVAGEPWTVREPDGGRLWATNDVGDAVYGPGVLGICDAEGNETLVVAPPDGFLGWRRFLVLQVTGASRRFEADDRTALWFAVAPPEARGARAGFLLGGAAGLAATAAVAVAAGAAAGDRPVAWGIGAAVAFGVVSGTASWWAIDRVVRRVCRELVEPAPEVRRRCLALRMAFDAEGRDGPSVAVARRLLWDALGTPAGGGPARRR
jgi:hypothetical protein